MDSTLTVLQSSFSTDRFYYISLIDHEARSLTRFHNSCITEVSRNGIMPNILKAMEVHLLIERQPENAALVESLRSYYESCKKGYEATQRKNKK